MTLNWSRVNDDRVALYEVKYGTSSGSFKTSGATLAKVASSNATQSGTTPDLAPGTYYFAVRACTSGSALCSAYSSTVSTTITSSSPTSSGSANKTGLVAAYGFEETSGNNVTDASGTGSAGTISNATRVANGRYGKALQFNGANAWVTVNDSAALDLTMGMTLEAWVYPMGSQSGWRTVIMKEQPGELVYGLWANNLKPHSSIFIGGQKGLTGTQQLPSGQWSHLAATYDGQYRRLYVNGIQVAQAQQTGQILSSGGALRIGGNSVWGEYFNGYIDEVRIYNRALSTAEVQADMAVSVSGGAAGSKSVALAGNASDGFPDFIEVGEAAVDEQWQRIAFKKTFYDPVVVAKPLSGNDLDPAVVRIDGVDATGFSIRVQEWDYLDGYRGEAETVGYLVMERGRHQLPDGAWVEAGRVNTSKTDAFAQFSFQKAFSAPPVVLTSVTTYLGADAVTTRLHQVGSATFQVGMQEQEGNTQSHPAENIDYVAWEISAGTLDGIQYAVGRTPSAVTHNGYTLAYRDPFAAPPVLLADMQTTNDGDTASLRWQNKDAAAVDVWVEEEQSAGWGVRHGSEVVGYVLIGPAVSP